MSNIKEKLTSAVVFKDSTLHNLSDKRHLLGPTHSEAAAATGRSEAYETFEILSCSNRSLAYPATQVRLHNFITFFLVLVLFTVHFVVHNINNKMLACKLCVIYKYI